MKNYSIEDENIFEERTKFLLSLRKNKINLILFERRKLSEIRNKKALDLFNENKNNDINNITIDNIKSKLNDILLVQNTSENNFSNLLNEIIDNIYTFSNNHNIENIDEEIIESSVIEKIYNNLTINGYINNEEISLNVLTLFSIIIFVYNVSPCLKLYKNKFISKDKYIYLLSLFMNNNSNEEINYNSYRFISLLTKGSTDISNKLYDYNILEQIIDNNKFDKNIEFIKIKLICISNFDLGEKYNSNHQLSTKIQKLYISIFNEFILNKEFEKDLFFHFVIILKNLSFCINEIYIKNLLDTKIIPFLIKFDEDNNTITENLIKIIGNMSFISNEELLSDLYMKVIQYLLDIISNKKVNNFILGLTLWNINNFLANCDLCYEIFFNNGLISIYKNYILSHEVIDGNIFKEICISYKNLVKCIIEFNNFSLLKKINLIPLIIEGFKKINDNNLDKLGKYIIDIISLLFNINNEISDFNKFIFEKSGGSEYIFERINNKFLEKNNNGKDLDNENKLLNWIDILKMQLLSN